MEFSLSVFLAQLLNFVIIFFVFKKFVGNKIMATIQERRAILKQADSAVHVYEETMQRAEDEKNALLADALRHKETLLQEAEQLATQKANTVLKQAEHQAQLIVKQAEDDASSIQKQMEDAFVDGVKRTTRIVVKKLVNDSVPLQEAYIDELVQEFAK